MLSKDRDRKKQLSQSRIKKIIDMTFLNVVVVIHSICFIYGEEHFSFFHNTDNIKNTKQLIIGGTLKKRTSKTLEFDSSILQKI